MPVPLIRTSIDEAVLRGIFILYIPSGAMIYSCQGDDSWWDRIDSIAPYKETVLIHSANRFYQEYKVLIEGCDDGI